MASKKKTSKKPRKWVTDFGRVKVYAPTENNSYWRVVWKDENGKLKDTTAVDQASALKLAAQKEKAIVGGNANKPFQTCAEMIAAYISSRSGNSNNPHQIYWGKKHTQNQSLLLNNYVIPAIGKIACMKLTNEDLKKVINSADTPSKATHLKSCLKALINWGSADGWILAKTDTLFSGFKAMGKRKRKVAGESRLYVDKRLIPSHKAVSEVANYASEISGIWWYELMFNLAAYSGLRLGEIIDLDVSRINLKERTISVESQCLDVGGTLSQTLPKWNTTRATTYPKITPSGYNLADELKKRIKELKALEEIPELQDGSKRLLLFPNSEGGWLGASSFGSRVRRPAQEKANWQKDANKKFIWNFHSLRHVFCSYYYGDLKKDIRDVSIAAGHRSYLTTMEMYVGNVAGAIERLRD